MMEEHQLGGKLLASVSRSFYLTLKALPEGLREPLSLAYLLARAADTIADTAGVPEALKTECLVEFDRLVQRESRDVPGESNLCDQLICDFMPKQTDKDEAHLLERLREGFDALWKFPDRQLANIRGVLQPIVRGQMLDIERFPVDGQLRSLNKSSELDEYTWLVAGCVGDFWTRLCFEELDGAFAAGVSKELQIERGIRFGKGLQLVNILRDIAKDAAMGRCYLPAEEMTVHGLSIEDVRRDPAVLKPLLPKWQKLCREHLQCALEYIDAIEHKRLRYATALPLLLALRTMALIESATWEDRMKGVKVSRGEVTRILLEAGFASLRRHGLRKMAEGMQ
jgi:farnesyl-diphosphate farnesyltransferase